MPQQENTAAREPVSFEQAIEELEAVVRDLESNSIGLDQSLARYERGVQLLRDCRTILDAAERKIRLLTGVDAQGNPLLDDFDATATAERAPGSGCEPSVGTARNTVRGPRRGAADGSAAGELLF